jgi:citrate lyase subunit beta/citryl-CoA lyase
VSTFDPAFLLFVPGDRPDRFEKAASGEASGAILDLEDAVSVDRKAFAREATAAYLNGSYDPSRIAVRVNARNSPWFAEDIAMMQTRPVGAVILPKTADAATVRTVSAALEGVDIIAMIESASGVLHAAEIAAHPRCIALAFGPFDLAADLGSADTWDTLLPHRAQVVVAARAHGKCVLDGPTIGFTDLTQTKTDAYAAKRLGYDGKLLIHPAQIAPARSAFLPDAAEIARARRIIAAAERAMPAVLDGQMIDAPLVLAAQRTLRRIGQKS